MNLVADDATRPGKLFTPNGCAFNEGANCEFRSCSSRKIGGVSERSPNPQHHYRAFVSIPRKVQYEQI